MSRKRQAKIPRANNVFVDLGFDEVEAENLRIRSHLMIELVDRIDGMTQVEAARRLGVSQPRISHLRAGKISLFTIDALVNMLAAIGVTVRLSVTMRRSTTAA
jgi:predicted XRE-type DNA-binding protein